MQKIIRYFKSLRIKPTAPHIKIEVVPIRFTSWKDAADYLGKPIIACLVEEPDIIGILIGIEIKEHALYINDKSEAMLTIWSTNFGGTYRYPHWKCKPA